MSTEQKHQWLDDEQNYPLRVRFLTKEGLLSYEELSFLRRQGVDFDVDDGQIAEIQADLAEEGEAPAPPRGLALRALGSLATILLLLRELFQPSRSR